MTAPATSLPSLLSRVFGVDPVSEILTQDLRIPFKRHKNMVKMELMDEKRQPYSPFKVDVFKDRFLGFGRMFRLLSNKATITMDVWFRIVGNGDDRRVTLQKAELNFSEPWGGDYFFYCRGFDPKNPPEKFPDYALQYYLTPMPTTEELKRAGGWCERNRNKTCGRHLCCEKDPQDDYFEYVSASDEKWECNGVKFLKIDRLVIEENGVRPEIDARLNIRVNPKSFILPRFNVNRSAMDISDWFYGALVFDKTHNYFQKANRPGDVTAVVESFFMSFGMIRNPHAKVAQ